MKKNLLVLIFLSVIFSNFANYDSKSYQIKKANISDIDNLVEVHYASWHATYDQILDNTYLAKNTKERLKQYWEKFFTKQKQDNRFVLVAMCGEKVVGLISAGPIKIDKNESKAIASSFERLNYDAEIYKLYVLPSEQKKGVGKLLLQESYTVLAHNGFKKIIVRAFTQNTQACKFYNHVGFEKLYSIEKARGIEVPYTIYGLELD